MFVPRCSDLAHFYKPFRFNRAKANEEIRQAIASDWQAVANDFWRALGHAPKQHQGGMKNDPSNPNY